MKELWNKAVDEGLLSLVIPIQCEQNIRRDVVFTNDGEPGGSQVFPPRRHIVFVSKIGKEEVTTRPKNAVNLGNERRK